MANRSLQAKAEQYRKSVMLNGPVAYGRVGPSKADLRAMVQGLDGARVTRLAPQNAHKARVTGCSYGEPRPSLMRSGALACRAAFAGEQSTGKSWELIGSK